ncbi:MAG: hypothetical protein ACRD0Z_14785 [Acidimicrobiales bacterium]
MADHAPEPSFTDRLLLDVRARQDSEGRLPMPDLTGEEIFPFEGEILVRHIDDPVIPEPPRAGEQGGKPCHACSLADEDTLMASEHWRLHGIGPSGVPVAVLLYPRQHVDLDQLPDERARELGPLMAKVEAAIKSLGGIGQVHINKWGDGGAHLHIWFFGRPEGLLQLRGSCLTVWDEVLPKRSQEEWDGTNDRIVRAIEARGGLSV